MLSPYEKIDSKRLERFFSKNNLLWGKLKIRQSKLQQQYNTTMLRIVYWDVPSLKKTFKEKQAVVAAGRPKTVERSFSSLKHIKSFSQNKIEQGRLSDLGLISIESQLLTEAMKTKSFQDSVITKFASAEKRTEFTFKSLSCIYRNSETLSILVLCSLL